MTEVTVVKKETKMLEKYYVIRAIKETKGCKACVAEKICETEPTEEEIGMFLYNQKADFCSVLTNYRFAKDFPFA